MRTVAGMLGGYTKVSVDGDTEYGATESAQFDYAIVVDKSERGRAQMDEIRLRCAAAGLEASAIFESVQCDELYLLLRVGASTLSATCAAEGSPIQCDERALAAMCADMPARFPGAGVGPVVVPDDRDETPRAPFEFIYAPFSARPEYAELWRAKDDSLTPGGPFGSALRLKTLVLLLERPPSLGGCGFSLSALRARLHALPAARLGRAARAAARDLGGLAAAPRARLGPAAALRDQGLLRRADRAVLRVPRPRRAADAQARRGGRACLLYTSPSPRDRG